MWAELGDAHLREHAYCWEIFWHTKPCIYIYTALCYKLASPLDALLLLYFINSREGNFEPGRDNPRSDVVEQLNGATTRALAPPLSLYLSSDEPCSSFDLFHGSPCII